MRRAVALLLASALLLVSAACQSRSDEVGPPPPEILLPPGATQDGDHVVFPATGTGVSDRPGATGRALAEEAARVSGRARILELLKGTHIVSDTKIGDVYGTSVEARAYVEGWLRGVTYGDPVFDGETCRLPAELRLHEDALHELPRFVR